MSKWIVTVILVIVGLSSVFAMEENGRSNRQRDFFRHMRSFLQQMPTGSPANPSTDANTASNVHSSSSSTSASDSTNPSNQLPPVSHTSTSGTSRPPNLHTSTSSQSQPSTSHSLPSSASTSMTSNSSSNAQSFMSNTSGSSTSRPSTSGSSKSHRSKRSKQHHASSRPSKSSRSSSHPSTSHPSTSHLSTSHSSSSRPSTSRLSTSRPSMIGPQISNHPQPSISRPSTSNPSNLRSSTSNTQGHSTSQQSATPPSTSNSLTLNLTTSDTSPISTSQPPQSSTLNPSTSNRSSNSLTATHNTSQSSTSHTSTSRLPISSTSGLSLPESSICDPPQHSISQSSTSNASERSPPLPSTTLSSFNRNLQSCMDALNAASASMNSDDYADEMHNLFRPAKNIRKAGPVKRGPKIMMTKMKLCCLQRADLSQSLPRGRAMTALTEAGLGPRTSDNIRMNLNAAEFRELLYSIFTPLRGVNFTLCTITRGRVLSPIPSQVEYSPGSLRSHLGRRFAGQILIVPSTSIHSASVVSTTTDRPTGDAQHVLSPEASTHQIRQLERSAADITANNSLNEEQLERNAADVTANNSLNEEQLERNAADVTADNSLNEEVSLRGRGQHPPPNQPVAEMDDTLPDMRDHSNPARLMVAQRNRALRNLQGMQEITLHRANVYSDVLNAYRSSSILRSTIRDRSFELCVMCN